MPASSALLIIAFYLPCDQEEVLGCISCLMCISGMMALLVVNVGVAEDFLAFLI